MNEVDVTLCGNVGDSPSLWETGVRPFARMSVACTPRIRQEQEWADGPTQWLQIKCWGRLAQNVAASIRKGDSVMVTGTYRLEEYTNEDGVTYKTPVVFANAVGFDLRRTRAQAVKVRSEDEHTLRGGSESEAGSALAQTADEPGEDQDHGTHTEEPSARVEAPF